MRNCGDGQSRSNFYPTFVIVSYGVDNYRPRRLPMWMKILIIGGTVFLGRAIGGVTLARGHTITMLNRGNNLAAIPPGVEHITADRDGDLAVLAGRTWDAVIDTCAYLPRQVRSLLAALQGRPHYTLVSSVSAYSDLSRSGLTEESALSAPLMDDVVTAIDGVNYGPLKSACEQVAGAGALIIRPGIIVGPHDPSDRFSYWVGRIAAGGEVLAAGNPATPVQLIDVRDLAAWILAAIEKKLTGVFNTVGPAEPLTMQQLFALCLAELNPATRLVWVDDGFLVAQGITEWMQLPLYIPAAETRFAGMFAVNGSQARRHGLKLRSLSQTAADTWKWIQKRPSGAAMKTGLAREQEAKLIAAWETRP